MSAGIKKILNIFFILLIGGLGGVAANQFLLPRLSAMPFFADMAFVRRSADGITIINPTEEIIISESTAVEDAVDRIRPCIAAVWALAGSKPLSQGTAFIVTSDGLLVTSADLVIPQADRYYVFLDSGESFSALVERVNQDSGLALLSIEKDNLPVVSLGELENLRLGSRVILAAAQMDGEALSYFVNLGAVRTIDGKTLQVTLEESSNLANGSPLINIEGKVIGLNIVRKGQLVESVSVDKLKKLIGLN